jgi:hypothetical protein
MVVVAAVVVRLCQPERSYILRMSAQAYKKPTEVAGWPHALLRKDTHEVQSTSQFKAVEMVHLYSLLNDINIDSRCSSSQKVE